MARHALVPVLFAGILAAVLADTPRCDANNHHVQLDEVMAGCGGDPHIQFVELLFPQGQNLWATVAPSSPSSTPTVPRLRCSRSLTMFRTTVCRREIRR